MDKNTKYTQYLNISRYILDLNDISPYSKMILAYIESFYNKPGKVFNCSNNFISKELNIPITTVKRCLNELLTHNHIIIDYTAHNWGKSNRIIYSSEIVAIDKALKQFKEKYGPK